MGKRKNKTSQSWTNGAAHMLRVVLARHRARDGYADIWVPILAAFGSFIIQDRGIQQGPVLAVQLYRCEPALFKQGTKSPPRWRHP